jgi:hypothetical protein
MARESVAAKQVARSRSCKGMFRRALVAGVIILGIGDRSLPAGDRSGRRRRLDRGAADG